MYFVFNSRFITMFHNQMLFQKLVISSFDQINTWISFLFLPFSEQALSSKMPFDEADFQMSRLTYESLKFVCYEKRSLYVLI